MKKLTVIVASAALLGSIFGAEVAAAHTLSKSEARNALRTTAKRICTEQRWARGCDDYKVLGVKELTRHKSVGNVSVTDFDRDRYCTLPVVIKLHELGDIAVYYDESDRRCSDL